MDQIYSSKDIDSLAERAFNDVAFTKEVDEQNREVLSSSELMWLAEDLYKRAERGDQSPRASLIRGMAVAIALGARLAQSRGEVDELYRLYRKESA